jgi:hypothetical protein
MILLRRQADGTVKDVRSRHALERMVATNKALKRSDHAGRWTGLRQGLRREIRNQWRE